MADGFGNTRCAFDADKRDRRSAYNSARRFRDLMGLDTYKLCGAALICAVAALLLRYLKKEFELPLTLAGSVLLLVSASAMARPIAQYLTELIGASHLVGDAANTLLRALAIALMTKLAADLCREMGTPSVATSLETAAKFEIIILTLPLVSSVIESVKELLAGAGI